MKPWFVYIVKCQDATLYTGITTDVERRLAEHNEGKRAAQYTRARRPVVLVYHEICATRSEALQREYAIKQLTRDEKHALITTVRF